MRVEVNEIANALAHGAEVTLRLEKMGITVIAAMANGRRPLLYVTRMPPDVPFVVKRSYPNHLGGRTVVRAAKFDECQLESMHDEPGVRAPAPHLQVVANG